MDNDWTKVLGFPGYRVYKHEIDERRKHVTLWIRRKRGNRILRCPGCGRRVREIHEVIERAVRDLPCFEYTTTVMVELYRLRCPDCGLKTEQMPQLPRSLSEIDSVVGSQGGVEPKHFCLKMFWSRLRW
jgi:transposase